MKRFVVSPALFDAAPFSHAVRVDGALYTSSIAALDRSGALVAPGDLVAQARHIYAALGSILDAGGACWSDVVKVNHFLMPPGASPAELEGLMAVMAEHLPPGEQAGTDVCFGAVHEGQRLQVELIAQIGVEKRILPGLGDGASGPLWAEGVRAGRHIYLSGRRAPRSARGALREETAAAYSAFDTLLGQAGIAWADIVRVRQFATNTAADFNHVREGRVAYVPAGAFTSTSVCCMADDPLDPQAGEWAIAVDLEAATGLKLCTNTSAMPITPATAHALSVGGLVHMQAEIATDDTDAIVHAGDIEAQSRYVFQNMTKLLDAGGCDWSDVVTSRVFCREAEHIETVRRIERLWAGDTAYARSDVVCRFFHTDALLEVELTAARR